MKTPSKNTTAKSPTYQPVGQGLITNFDLSGYTGQSGHNIRITTRGDHHAQRVRLVIRDLLGVPVEAGDATWDETTAAWIYRTTANFRFKEIVLVTATVDSRHHQSGCQVTCVPIDLHFPTQFKTALWAQPPLPGRWKGN